MVIPRRREGGREGWVSRDTQIYCQLLEDFHLTNMPLIMYHKSNVREGIILTWLNLFFSWDTDVCSWMRLGAATLAWIYSSSITFCGICTPLRMLYFWVCFCRLELPQNRFLNQLSVRINLAFVVPVENMKMKSCFMEINRKKWWFVPQIGVM